MLFQGVPTIAATPKVNTHPGVPKRQGGGGARRHTAGDIQIYASTRSVPTVLDGEHGGGGKRGGGARAAALAPGAFGVLVGLGVHEGLRCAPLP